MLKPQRKMKKTEIKEDKFVNFTMEAKNYVEENSKQVMVIAGGILVFILLIMSYVFMHSGTINDATTLYGKATLEYQAMNYTKAKTFLEDLVSEYDGTDAATKGKFLLGNIYFKENKIVDAQNQFQDFIDSYSDNDIILASGYAGLAACNESTKNYSVAADYYDKAYESMNDLPEGANYLYLAGLNYRKAGDLENAKEAFEKVSKNFKDSERSFDAKEELILLADK